MMGATRQTQKVNKENYFLFLVLYIIFIFFRK